MKTVAIVQARTSSKRFPNKVLAKVGERTVIELLLSRLKRAREIDEIVVAIARDSGSAQLSAHVESLGFNCVVGEENDVLGRFAQTAEFSNADIVVRITGDCPLIDPLLVDEVIRLRKSKGTDFCSNTNPPTFADGLDVEVFTVDALKTSNTHAITRHEREHVTPFIINSKSFSKSTLINSANYSNLRLTIDEPVDLQVLERILVHFNFEDSFSYKDIENLYAESPSLFETNSHLSRNEGSELDSGQKLWNRAKRVIPGGNMLLSKRAEMFLPGKWPSYFTKAKGCEVWDLDQNRYIDMSTMGVGSNSLGYGDDYVDGAVREAISLGNMSTLNAPEEVYLAEKLIEIEPWAGMVRFARTGGEANAIAVRIARAATGKEKIAICGYHGWHDWYLSANLADDDNLDGHLLPGLKPSGVPRSLQGTVLTFRYNDIDSLKEIISKHEVGVIKMEVIRSEAPHNGFLQQVRALASKHGIVLIFDECTSGFRETYGGIHSKFGVDPDIAVFGKALGNGYAITAVLGRKEIMEAAQATFISSTFWTERIGSVAALATLSRMNELKSWEKLNQIGLSVRVGWQQLAEKHGLNLTLSGIPALSSFNFESAENLKYKTFITQEMLKKGFLASNIFYASTAHHTGIIDEYMAALDPVFEVLGRHENGTSTSELLDGPVCHSGFNRLN